MTTNTCLGPRESSWDVVLELRHENFTFAHHGIGYSL